MNFEDVITEISNLLQSLETVRVFPYILAIGIFVFSMLLAKGSSIFLRRYLKDKFDKDSLGVLLKVTYYGIIVMAIILILPIMGINTSGLLVAGGITGIILGFASQNTVGNLISGLLLMVERPIKIGSKVEIDGVKGFVEDIGLMSTILRNFDGLYIRIPNEKVFTNNIINISANVARRLEYTIGIRYSDDANKAIKIIGKIMEEHPFVLKNPSPDIFVDELGDNSVNILVRAWMPETQWFGTKKELLWVIKSNLEKEGIQIPFPQRVIWYGNEETENKELN